MSFFDEISKVDVDSFRALVDSRTDRDVDRALARCGQRMELPDFAALISEPARVHYLKEMATLSMQLTRRRFGRAVNMYLPLYLSNLCTNRCAYCGFSSANKFRRTVLTLDEVRDECEAIKAMGYENILLVSGESERRAGMPYFREVMPLVKRYAAYLQVEVQPLSAEDYAELKGLGLDAVCVYQETYHPGCYRENHLSGRKADMRWRMETPDRAGQAGLDKVGLAALLGLYDPRVDLMALAAHVLYMRDHYPKVRLAISFPRLRPAAGAYEPRYPVGDAKLVQVITAWRIFDNELDLTISTREGAEFRDLIIPLGVTGVSAGSSTEPGGYAHHGENLEQWAVNDSRGVDEVCAALRLNGLDPVFHDASTTYFRAV
ncbi:MAG: 2-iminoacetate synthase ThiH [Succinivibrionaceae bacterium]|nr:2-iminoacetate synthase ThiH [Succinivibrionaceae bacterium]